MPGKQDLQFGHTAVSMGVIKPEQLAFALQLQEQKRKNGEEVTISAILISNGYIDTTQQEQVFKQCQLKETESIVKGAQLDTTKSFGRYQIIEEVGRGGMGVIYRAFDPKLDRYIALKMLLGGTEEDTMRFVREAKSMAKLHHPHIINVYDIGEIDAKSYFTMDFIEGCSLHELAKKNTLKIPKIVEIMVKVAQAVNYAHSKGIIHRDLKPANIMLEQKRHPKVMDFGLAKVIDDDNKLSRTGTVMGTVQYMPPEQAEGKIRKIDSRSDVYSLGIILYELLAGQLPFRGNSFVKIIVQIVEKEPIPPSQIKKSIPKSLENICLKAIQKKKEDRYASAADFAKDLALFSQGGKVKAKTTKKAKGKNFYGVLAIGLVVVTLLAMLIFSSKTTSDVFAMQVQMLDGKKNKRYIFKKGEKIQVEVKWEIPQVNTIQIEIYGTEIQYYAGNYKGATGTKFLPILYKKSGKYDVSIRITAGDKSKNMPVHFEVKPKENLASKKLPANKIDKVKRARFRGRLQNTGSYETTANIGNRLKWKTTRRLKKTTFLLYQGFVYIASGDFFVLNIKTGKLHRKISAKGSIAPYTVSIADDIIYYGTKEGNLHAIDATNGLYKWGYQTGKKISSAPIVVGQKVYFGGGDNYFYALTNAGELIWKRKFNAPIRHGSASIANNMIYTRSMDGKIYALDMDTRETKWHFNASSRIKSSLTLAYEHIYFRDQNFLYALNAKSGKQLWRVPSSYKLYSLLAVVDETIFNAHGKFLQAWDVKTGQLKWQESIAPEIISPLVTNKVVYMGNAQGNLYAFSLQTKKLKWKYKATNRKVLTPIVYKDSIYFQSGGYVYALQ